MKTLFSKVLACLLIGGLSFVLSSFESFSAPKGDAFGVYDTATGKWYIKTILGNTIVDGAQWGDATMAPVIGDYNGDGKTDMGVYGTNTGVWKIRSVDGQLLRNDNPFPAGIGGLEFTPISKVYVPEYFSFDRWGGDRIGDPCLFQYTNKQSIFHVMRSCDGAYTNFVFQTWTDCSGFSADYDGDQVSDLTAYGKLTGDWLVFVSYHFISEGPGYASNLGLLGGYGYSAYADDLDGDGKSDLSVGSTNGQWAIKFSSTAYSNLVLSGFGGPGLTPVPGDYDGDGMAELALYEEATGQWTIRLDIMSDATTTFQLGGPGKIPFAFPYDVFAFPTNFTASLGTYLDKVRLQWDSTADATAYEVYRNSSNDTSTVAKLGETTSALYDDTTAEPNLAYYYWVKAKYAQGISGFSSFAIGARTPFVNPEVKLNGVAGPLTVSAGTPITVTVQIEPAAFTGVEADWWVLAQGFGAWYYLVLDGFSLNWIAAADYTAMHPIYQGPLFDLAPFFVLESYSWLPPGAYAFYFAIDTVMDGVLTLDALHYDSALLTIQ